MISEGTIVEVYEDPVTMQRKEGNAKVIKCTLESNSGLNLYRVNFIGDDPEQVMQRWIADKPLCCCFEKAGDNDDYPAHSEKVINASAN